MRLFFTLLIGFMGFSTTSSTAELTYVDIINRLTNLELLSTLPVNGEKCQQWSSYDRNSKIDETTGKYVAWSANNDGAGIIREEFGQKVLAEINGPGIIWRIWAASPQAGHVKILLDEDKRATIDLPFKSYFDGSTKPFNHGGLCYVAAQGWNNYVPIPFAKNCKILADKDFGRYYHFTYSTYPKGTVLPTFKLDLSAKEMAALQKVNDFLETKCGTDPAGERTGETTEVKTVEINAGEKASVVNLIGPRAITALRVKLDLPAPPNDISVLRELCLRITWDGAAKPQVWAPLGDFFGSAPGFKKYRSLPLGVTDEGMYCLWYMPFGKNAHVEIINDGRVQRTVNFQITHAPLTDSIRTLGRFHAKWQRDMFLPQEPERRAIDWTMLRTNGRGRYVGIMLHVWNPRGAWWGEGDEKFFVDGEKFPSTFGTGSEDYFGYAWGSPQIFHRPYHNQPHNDGGNRGHVSVNRWHIGDNVPFQTSFEASIEKYFPDKKPTLYAATAYWYQTQGQTDGYKEVPVEERTGYYKPPPRIHEKNAMEAETLTIMDKTGGNTRVQNMAGFGDGWNNNAHLWWTGAKPGNQFALAFPVNQEGTYKLSMQLTKSWDYAIVQLFLDGIQLGNPIDLYSPRAMPTGKINMGDHELSKGDHQLMIRIIGANVKAPEKYMVGLDYIKLEINK